MTLLNISSLLKSNLTYSVFKTVFSRTKFTKFPKKPRNYEPRTPRNFESRMPRNFESRIQGNFESRIPRNVEVRIPKHHKKPLFEPQPLELPPKVPVIPKQKFDYFLVLDIEATCDSPVNVDPQEILEFPVIKVNAQTFRPEAKFHAYVRPTVEPQLSDFCTLLTGIIQEMIDQQPDFKVVFQNFLEWLEKEGVLKPGVNFAFVTCSDPDLEYFFPLQCKISEIEVPDFMKRWINVKRSFCDIPPYTYPANLTTMLKFCDLIPEGDLHSGIDDATNLARVLKDLAERGLVFDFNAFKE